MVYLAKNRKYVQYVIKTENNLRRLNYTAQLNYTYQTWPLLPNAGY